MFWLLGYIGSNLLIMEKNINPVAIHAFCWLILILFSLSAGL